MYTDHTSTSTDPKLCYLQKMRNKTDVSLAKPQLCLDNVIKTKVINKNADHFSQLQGRAGEIQLMMAASDILS